MEYTLYAEMRDKRIITIATWSNLDFLENILENFIESDYIERFVIAEGNVVVNDKYLKPKGKGRCLKK